MQRSYRLRSVQLFGGLLRCCCRRSTSFCASAVIGSRPSAGSTTSDVWRNVRVPTSLRNAPTRFNSRVLAWSASARRLAYSSSESCERLPSSAGRCTGMLRRSSLDHVPEMSGSPQGVFGVVYGLTGAAEEAAFAGVCARAGIDNAAMMPIALTSAPMVNLRMPASREEWMQPTRLRRDDDCGKRLRVTQRTVSVGARGLARRSPALSEDLGASGAGDRRHGRVLQSALHGDRVVPLANR